MQLEIAILGPDSAIMPLCRALDEVGLEYIHRGKTGPIAAVVIPASERNLDDKLRTVSRITRRLERNPVLEGRFEYRVHNLDYAEPSVPTDLEAYCPIPSIRIQPWSPDQNPAPGRKTVIIAAENAFGTGKHPSSRLCLRSLDSMSCGKEGMGRDVLDFGCGTGLLAIVAALQGAEKVLGVEVDSQSVRTAKKNVALNRLEHKIFIREGSWDAVQGKFDLILANLVPSVLFRSGRNIPNHLKTEARAVVAGFSLKQRGEMERFFSEAGLSVEKNMSLDGWALLIMQHRQDF